MSEKSEKPSSEKEEPIPNTGVAAPASNERSRSSGTTEAEAARRKPREESESDKREPRKPATRILEQQIKAGLDELERSTAGLIFAGLSAGLELGFSVFLMAVMISMGRGVLPEPVVSLLVAASYTVGFILVVIGRSELFTEQTALVVLPVMNGRASISQLLRTWSLIFVANIIGGAIFALMAVLVGPSLGVIKPEAFGELADQVVRHSWSTILLSAVLAGWLMALLSWLVTAARETTAQVLMILLITATIGLGHLHHVIAGSIEALVGLFAGQGVTLFDFFHFLLWSAIGNSIGGVIFVAAIKYNHIVRSDKQADQLDVE